MGDFVKDLSTVGLADVSLVGGKNASLGEMINHLGSIGVKVPGGFAVTTSAYRCFIERAALAQEVSRLVGSVDVDDVRRLADVGREVRQKIVDAAMPTEVSDAIERALRASTPSSSSATFAVRSSATAEDMPDASFAGQQESFLNVPAASVLEAVKRVFASLFNNRAIAYRYHQGFAEEDVSISVGVQHMVRSDLASSGVMFTLDTESGFEQVVFVTGSYGLGEAIVQGAVNPDEFYLYKPNLRDGRPSVLSRTMGNKSVRMIFGDSASLEASVLTENVPIEEQNRYVLDDGDLELLGSLALKIEDHYGRPMDIEWAKDGQSGEMFIVQARPETVESRSGQTLERHLLTRRGTVVVEGRAVGRKISSGPVRLVEDVKDMHRVEPGDILVTDMTDPDWEPVMKRAGAIVTNRGGRTCHAAIIARELGLAAVVGCRDATSKLVDGVEVTVSCAEGDTGYIYEGRIPFDVQRYELEKMPTIATKIMMNVANPERAFQFACLPHSGVGLARLEFVINNTIGVHPKALLELAALPTNLRKQIEGLILPYTDGAQFFVDRMAEGIATLGAAFAPEPVIVRLSDFKSNEYRHLVGGEQYEPEEENPMIGFRGAARYLSPGFAECFALECRAIRKARAELGLENIEIMVPFVRSPREAERVIELLAKNGLRRGENGLRIIMMCEIPTNVVLADEFLAHFDGFSIGSNDLTQLTLGVDRDSSLVADSFDERDEAVKALIRLAIQACRKAGKYVGICGQAPSDYPEFARWLADEGIDSLSLNPDSVVSTWLDLAEVRP